MTSDETADAAAEDPVAALYDVFRVDRATGAEEKIGSVEVTERGKLTILEVDTAHTLKLQGALESINAKPRIVEKVRPQDASEPGQTASQVTERDDPDFVQALNRYMRTYYGLSLG